MIVVIVEWPLAYRLAGSINHNQPRSHPGLAKRIGACKGILRELEGVAAKAPEPPLKLHGFLIAAKKRRLAHHRNEPAARRQTVERVPDVIDVG